MREMPSCFQVVVIVRSIVLLGSVSCIVGDPHVNNGYRSDIGVTGDPRIADHSGVDFDAERGSRYVRFCYAGTTADMAEAARRLKGWSRLKTRA